MPGKYNASPYRGDTFNLDFRLRTKSWNGSAWVTGDWMNLTGATAKCQMRAAASRSAALVAEGAVTIPDQNDPDTVGFVNITFTPEQTGAITATETFYDVEFTFPDGSVKTYLSGRLKWDGDVTN